MWLYIRLMGESLVMAFSALRENLLRTVLSLLGVTVGIFSIIAILTVVDALDAGIRRSFSFLGENVVYVQKWPWIFSPDAPWWEYMRRPMPTVDEYKFLEKNMANAKAVAVFDVKGGVTIKFRDNSVSKASVMGASYQYNQVADIPVEHGRYFTPQECEAGRTVVLVGHTLAEELFFPLSKEEVIGRSLKLRGVSFTVIGILEKQGENLLGSPSNDNLCIIPFVALSKMYASSKRGINPVISIKGFEDKEKNEEMEAEIRGLMRMKRGLKPRDKDNFALNRPEALAAVIDTIKSTLTGVGGVLAAFSILVGGFGIANIMFVSVKERTNLIGIQKSLGARNAFILYQFLFEAMFLSLIGGLVGMLLVLPITFFSTDTFIIELSIANVLKGLAISSVIGLVAGMAPAIVASRLDPVEAIRSK